MCKGQQSDMSKQQENIDNLIVKFTCLQNLPKLGSIFTFSTWARSLRYNLDHDEQLRLQSLGVPGLVVTVGPSSKPLKIQRRFAQIVPLHIGKGFKYNTLSLTLES